MKTLYSVALAASLLCLAGVAYAEETAKRATSETNKVMIISSNDGCAKKDGKAKVSRIIMRSTDGKTTSVDVSEHLAEARKAIAEEDSLSKEMKDKVLKSLDQTIAEMKGKETI
jgi:GMP synthase PP-ATPase subunit